VGGQQKWEDVAGGGGDNRGHIGGEGGPDGDGVDIAENTEVGGEGEGERISSEDSRGNGDGEGDMLEREVESVSSSPSLAISHSHYCFAADLVRLGGGGVIDGGEGDGSDVG
jgi:hypothetical protein